MARPGLARICLRDKRWRVSGLARPWRVAALVAALETEPESIPDLLVSAQRFFCGHPFSSTTYQGLLGAVRRTVVDTRYVETPGSHGLAVFDIEARRVYFGVRGVGWRRSGWLYYHDGEAFTGRRVPYRLPESWQVEGAPEDETPQADWNEAGPEPFDFLLADD
jgi:hypothetical protein